MTHFKDSSFKMAFIALCLMLFLAILSTGGVYGQNVTCGKSTFTDRYGSVSSPNYPGRYSGGIWCSYEINRPGEWLRISWDANFGIDGKMPYCYDDFIEVYIGCGVKRTKVSRFCSRNAGRPHPIYAKDGCAKLIFSSRSGSPGGQGFKLNYEARSLSTPVSTQKCSSDYNIYEPSGVIYSPGWPVGYQSSYLPSFGGCEWDVRQASSKRILVNVMDVDLRASGVSCYVFADKLSIKGKKSSVTSARKTYTYCSEDRPLWLNTDYYDLEIDFETSYFTSGNSRRGFVVGFVAYTDDTASTFSKIGAVAGGVIAIVVAIIAVFLLVRFCKRRRANRGYVQAQPHGASVPLPVVHPPPPPQVAYPQQTGYYPQAMAYPQPPYPQDQYKGFAPQPTDPPPAYPGNAPYPPPQSGYAMAPPGYGPQPGYPASGPFPYPPPQEVPVQKSSAPPM